MKLQVGNRFNFANLPVMRIFTPLKSTFRGPSKQDISIITTNIFFMKKVNLPIHITEIESLDELSRPEQELIGLSRSMTRNAYAPYSEFFVGAAVLLENGEVIKGSNQENAAYPSGLCAERVAVFSASALHPGKKMKAIAISARSDNQTMDHPVSPCGACRQVLLEYEVKQKEAITVFLSGETGKIYRIEKVRDLLPLSFTAEDLGKL